VSWSSCRDLATSNAGRNGAGQDGYDDRHRRQVKHVGRHRELAQAVFDLDVERNGARAIGLAREFGYFFERRSAGAFTIDDELRNDRRFRCNVINGKTRTIQFVIFQ